MSTQVNPNSTALDGIDLGEFEFETDEQAAERHARVQTTADLYLVPNEEVTGDATEILAREISGKLGTDRIQ